MRHIKAYKIFESDVNYLDTIVDILQYSADLGLDVGLLTNSNGYDDPIMLTKHNIMLSPSREEVEVIRVFIEHNPPEYSDIVFKYKDIKDDVNHLIRYMKQIGYNDYLYQDQYTEFNYARPIKKDAYGYPISTVCAIPNIVPNDDDNIGVIKITFYR